MPRPASTSSAASSRSGELPRAAGSTGIAPRRAAKARRAGSGSETITEAPASIASAVTVRPIMPAPVTSTPVPSSRTRVDAASSAATAVAVAHEAGAATSAGSCSDTRTTVVPARSCTWVAKLPDSSQPRCTRSCPYFASDRHFWVRPRRQRSHSPQLTVTDQTTRSPSSSSEPSERTAPSPTATTRPTCSWPSTSGAAAGRAPRTVFTSDPQIVASSTSTSASPGESRTPGAARASWGRPGSFQTMATGAGLRMRSGPATRTIVCITTPTRREGRAGRAGRRCSRSPRRHRRPRAPHGRARR